MNGRGSAARARLREFYVGRGFQLDGRAFSRYFDTHHAASNLFGFTVVPPAPEATGEGAGPPYRATDSAYFALLSGLGDQAKVLQSRYLDYCGDPATVPCRTYAAYTLKNLEGANLPAATKMRFLLHALIGRGALISAVTRRVHQRAVRSGGLLRLVVPDFVSWGREPSPIGSLRAFEWLIDDLVDLERGQMVFAHLMLPHFPYFYDRYCRFRPADFLGRSAPQAAPLTNTSETRSVRYAHYLEQLECTTSQVERVLEALARAGHDDAIVIVHGDHGSRIGIRDPQAHDRDLLSDSDLLDAYSTLFAVRAPMIPPGYRAEPRALDALLLEVLRRALGLEINPPQAADFVYLTGEPAHTRAMPESWTR